MLSLGLGLSKVSQGSGTGGDIGGGGTVGQMVPPTNLTFARIPTGFEIGWTNAAVAPEGVEIVWTVAAVPQTTIESMPGATSAQLTTASYVAVEWVVEIRTKPDGPSAELSDPLTATVSIAIEAGILTAYNTGGACIIFINVPAVVPVGVFVDLQTPITAQQQIMTNEITLSYGPGTYTGYVYNKGDGVSVYDSEPSTFEVYVDP